MVVSSGEQIEELVMETAVTRAAHRIETLDSVVIRFAGDYGDGMQLTGDRYAAETASLGNDLATLPNFPAEIRAPQGTLPGVSSFQLHFADHDVLTPGDAPDVDRKSTRLNSSHVEISYAVFCLKKKKKIHTTAY